MRGAWVGLGLVSGALAGACVNLQPYQCSDDSECRWASAQGWCEAAGFCSYPDDECPTGRRYSDLAGPLANECTGVEGSETSTTTTSATEPTDPTTTGPTGPGTSTSDSSDGSEVSAGPECGNGIVEPGEECDQLDDEDGDGCNTDCVRSGSVRWSEIIASEAGGDDRLFGLTQLASGDVMGVGYFQADTQDILLSRWTVTGEEVARVVHPVAGATWSDGQAVTLAALGEVFVCGIVRVDNTNRSWIGRWNADLDQPPVFDVTLPAATAPGGCYDIVFLSGGNINAVGGNGTNAWVYRFAASDPNGGDVAEIMDANETRFRAAARAEDGDLFVAGQVTRLATVFEPTSATALGMPLLQTVDDIQVQSIRVANDVIYLGGFLDVVDFDDRWLGAFELDGTERWVFEFQPPSLGSDEVEDIALDQAGNVYAVGHLVQANDDPDRWIAKFDTEGNLVWERNDYQGSELGFDRLRSIEVLLDGDLIVVAEITSAAGDYDAWIARLAP